VPYRIKGTHTPDPTHAADSYSWIKPPSTSCLRMREGPDQAGHDRGIQYALALRSERPMVEFVI
jgi:hypothetical protein